MDWPRAAWLRHIRGVADHADITRVAVDGAVSPVTARGTTACASTRLVPRWRRGCGGRFRDGGFSPPFPSTGVSVSTPASPSARPHAARRSRTAGNERPGRDTVDDAIAWFRTTKSAGPDVSVGAPLRTARALRPGRTGRPVADGTTMRLRRATPDRQILDALGPDVTSSVIVFASDHGEAFGEHGEISHGLFVYDTTLRVPLVIAGAGVPARAIGTPVSLVDVSPTVLALLGPRVSTATESSSLARYRGSLRRASVRGVFCAAPRLRLEPAAIASIGSIQIHGRAQSRALRLAARCGRTPGSGGGRAPRRRHEVQIGRTLPLRSRPAACRSTARLGRLQALGYASGAGGAPATRPPTRRIAGKSPPACPRWSPESCRGRRSKPRCAGSSRAIRRTPRPTSGSATSSSRRIVAPRQSPS